ncbi:hypothetical protein R1flu_013346 [Riccia fluitans]|uniref:BRCT domain-containing protein n=1 Tax=Riccia fluitans TaxID=41844 RepID=A0ABD1YDR1_9MARC
MSTQTKKRKLPEWITSGINTVSKEAKSTTTKNAGTSTGKISETEETGSWPSVKEVTKGSSRASSSKAKEAKVSGTIDCSEDEDVQTWPSITEELDAPADKIVSERKSDATNSTSLMGKDWKLSGEITERKPRRDLESEVKEGPEERVGGALLRRPSRECPARVKEEPVERIDDTPRRKPSVESEFNVKEESKGVEDAPRRNPSNEWQTKIKQEPEEKAEGHPSKQGRDGLNDDGGSYTSSTHQVHTDKSNHKSKQGPNGKMQQTSTDELRNQDGDDAKEQDISTSLPTRKATVGSSKPLVRQFSKLLEGVIFTISGLVNPARAELRKMGLDMGADYSPSWSSDSTLLVAALANTPSFNQVKAAGGTIVNKDWVMECYKRRELVPIEKYLMHVGNPWRAGHNADESTLIGVAGAEEGSPSQNVGVKTYKGDNRFPSRSSAEEGIKVPDMVKTKATRAQIEQWFGEDLNSLRSWLEKRQEKPEQGMLEATAAQGLVACLEDAIKSLEETKGLNLVLESWEFIPRVIRELEKEVSQVNRTERLITEAERMKSIYTAEMEKRGFSDAQREDDQIDDDATDIMSDTDSRDPADYNSDDTEDLDEDEITQCQIQILHRFGLD